MNNKNAPADKRPVWQIYFCTPQVAARHQMEPGTVFITWTVDRWNDFKKRTGIEIAIQPVMGERIELSASIGFFRDSEAEVAGIELMQDMIQAKLDPVPIDASWRFFTMLPAIENYRSLVQDLGQADAQVLLLAIFDVVALREFSLAPKWLDEAETSDLFALSFVRSSTAYYAYKATGPVLRGLQFEELGRLSQTLGITLRRDGYHQPVALHFAFDHKGQLPKRIAVLIGKNGVGKSQALTLVAREALSGKLKEGDGVTRAVISRLLAFAPTNEAESVFPSDQSTRHKIWYRRFSLNRARRSSRGGYVSDLMLQVARSEYSIKEMSRSRLLFEAVWAIHSPEQLVLPTRNGGSVSIDRLLANPGGEQARLEMYQSIDPQREPMREVEKVLYPLSSGEVSFLKFAAQICLHIENGSLVLLDEPETHLHPNFVSRFVSLLDTVLELTGSSALLATHSAYIVKEVFKEQVTILRFDDGVLNAIPPTMQTFGADVGAVSYFVFGEDEPSRLAAKLQKEILEKNATWEVVYSRYKDEFSLEYLNRLRAAVEQS